MRSENKKRISYQGYFLKASIIVFSMLSISTKAFTSVFRRSGWDVYRLTPNKVARVQTHSFFRNCFITERPKMRPVMHLTVDSSSVSLSRHPFKSPNNAPSDSDSLNESYSWNQLGLTHDLISALKDSSIEAPTPIQRMAIPHILSGGNGIAFAAATGSGKTLAYLLPMIQLLKAQELLGDRVPINKSTNFDKNVNQSDVVRTRPLRKNKRPRAIILAPTRELAEQILSVLKSLSHKAKISSELVIGGEDYGKQRKRLESRPVDIVVATPGRLVKHMEAGHVFLGSVGFVVLDEVDTMLEQGFQGDIIKILHPLLYKNIKGSNPFTEIKETAPQVILTTATLTNAVKRLLGDNTVKPSKNYKIHSPDSNKSSNNIIHLPPNIRVIEAPGLHRAVPTLQQIFIDVGQMDKLSLVTDAIQSHRHRNKKNIKDDNDIKLTLVFCNTVASCRAAEHALAEAGLESLCYHGELNSSARAENLERFRSGEFHILVCTDIAARGLDVPEVDHVVMFDFPLNPLDYLHRAGRTARGTSGFKNGESQKNKGKVTALVAKRDKVLAKAIEEAVMRGDRLDSLTGRKSDYLPSGKLGNAGRLRNKTSSHAPKKFQSRGKREVSRKARRS